MSRVLTNDFSWSKSRHEKFRECLRAYYFYYYRSWGGWEATATPDVRELYLLKKLSNRYTWAGSAVHDAVRDTLLDVRAGREVDAGLVRARVHARMREDFKLSARQAYRSQKLRGSFRGLVEHEYAEPVGGEEWKRNWQNVEQALSWFFSSRWLALARTLKPHQWLEVDEGAFNSNFEHKGVRFFAIPDFAYLDEAGDPVVVDWKTGKARDGYDEQVIGYAVYLSKRYRVPVERVKASLVYLNEGTEVSVQVDPDRVRAFEAYFDASVRQMRALLDVPETNRPKAEEAFPMASDRATCTGCVFRRVCGRAEARAVSPVQLVALPEAGLSVRPSELAL